MRQQFTFYSLRLLKSAFWLLPALGFVTWAASGVGLDWVLSQAYPMKKAVQLTASPSPTVKVVSINVSVNQKKDRSTVVVNTIGSSLKTLKFEFPVSNDEQLEAAIAQELGVSRSQVKRLIRQSVK